MATEPTPGLSLETANRLIVLLGPVRVQCGYTNWRGKFAIRRLHLRRLWFGSTEYHPEPGLMLEATDLKRGGLRSYRVEDFHLHTLTAIQEEKP